MPIDIDDIKDRQNWFDSEILYLNDAGHYDKPSTEAIGRILPSIQHWRVARVARVLSVLLLLVFGTFAVSAGIATWFALQEKRRANVEKALAEARQLAAESRWLLANQPDYVDVSTLLAVFSLERSSTPEGRAALRSALASLPPFPRRVGTTHGKVWDVGLDVAGRKALITFDSGAALGDTESGLAL